MCNVLVLMFKIWINSGIAIFNFLVYPNYFMSKKSKIRDRYINYLIFKLKKQINISIAFFSCTTILFINFIYTFNNVLSIFEIIHSIIIYLLFIYSFLFNKTNN